MTTTPDLPRIPFNRPDDRWGVFWSNQVARSRISDVIRYRGTHALQVTITGSSNNHGYAAVGTTHQLDGLRTGVKVSFWVRVAQPEPDSGLRFWAYDGADKPAWATKTPCTGTEVPLPSDTAWTRYRWTVPAVDQVTAIGMQIYSATEQPLTIWLGAADW